MGDICIKKRKRTELNNLEMLVTFWNDRNLYLKKVVNSIFSSNLVVTMIILIKNYIFNDMYMFSRNIFSVHFES